MSLATLVPFSDSLLGALIALVVLLVGRVVRLLALGSCVVRLLLTVGQVVGGVGGVCVSRMCGASMRLLCVGVLCVPAECRAGPV